MAQPHLAPGQVTDLMAPRGSQHDETRALFKGEQIEVLRVVLEAGKPLPEHQVKGELTVQCLSGRVEFTALGQTRGLSSGHFLYLSAGERHSVRAVDDSTLLLTIVRSPSG